MKPVVIVLIGAGAVFAGRWIMAAITHVLGVGRAPSLEWVAGAIAAAAWFVLVSRELRRAVVASSAPKPRSLALYAICFFPFAFLMQIGMQVVGNRPVVYGKELIGGVLMTATVVFFHWFSQRKALALTPPPVVAEKPKFDI